MFHPTILHPTPEAASQKSPAQRNQRGKKMVF
jgi:hypothetical protein